MVLYIAFPVILLSSTVIYTSQKSSLKAFFFLLKLVKQHCFLCCWLIFLEMSTDAILLHVISELLLDKINSDSYLALAELH